MCPTGFFLTSTCLSVAPLLISSNRADLASGGFPERGHDGITTSDKVIGGGGGGGGAGTFLDFSQSGNFGKEDVGGGGGGGGANR